jgi:plasmid stabilization system protein ParE
MRIRWTEPAVRDFTQICDYIQEHGTAAIAHRVAHSMYKQISSLSKFPESVGPAASLRPANLY